MLSDCNTSIPTVDGEPKGCFLFKKYMLTAYHVPSIVPATILSIRDTAVNKTDKNPWLWGAYILMGDWGRGTDNKINMKCVYTWCDDSY